MSTSGYVAVLGLLLAALGTVLWLWSGSDLAPLLSGLAALGALLVALAGRIGQAGPKAPLGGEDASVGTVVAAAGFVVAVTGAAFGLWLVLIGAEILAFAAFLLLRERRMTG